ncbi:MAG: Ppx/GppA family phosphatase [Alphaproteobacteria bacterium]
MKYAILHGGPVAVIDIGSNSIRLVVYSEAQRSPVVQFSEKLLCGLGRNLSVTGRLSETAVERALAALRRFAVICEHIGVKDIFAVATEAVRRAENGAEFIEQAKNYYPCDIRILSCKEEAEFAAAGVAAGFVDPSGIAGDLGGGSLELIDIDGPRVVDEVSVPLGSLNLMDVVGASADMTLADVSRAEAYVDQHLNAIPWLEHGRGRPFYAIGGTWRALGRLHMVETGYPLHIVQHYTMTPKQLKQFYVDMMERREGALSFAKASKDRREMLPYGLLVLKRLVDRLKPSGIVFSVFGVREGLIYELLPPEEQQNDPLIAACESMALRRARSLEYGYELFRWMDRLFEGAGLHETPEERRLRKAACLLTDIGWCGHADYRGEKALGLIAQSSFAGVDHQERAFLALAVYYYYRNNLGGSFGPELRKLINQRWNQQAKIIALASRAANKLSAGVSGVINETTLGFANGKLVLNLPGKLEALDGETLQRRLKALAAYLECEFETHIG